MKLRIAGIQNDSIVDGPGIRLSIYVQGCFHRCPGCHNPETHNPEGGLAISLDDILERIKQNSGIGGVTFTGGEPFEQAPPLVDLAQQIRYLGLNLVIYSGYTYEELLAKSSTDRSVYQLMAAGWLLIDGPFLLHEQDYSLSFRGSRNQRIIDLPGSMTQGRVVEWTAGNSLLLPHSK